MNIDHKPTSCGELQPVREDPYKVLEAVPRSPEKYVMIYAKLPLIHKSIGPVYIDYICRFNVESAGDI